MKRTLSLLAIFHASVALADPPPATPAAPSASDGKAAAAEAKQARKQKPLVAVVLPGVKSVRGYEKVRNYTPPELDADLPIEESEVKLVEVVDRDEAMVLARPTMSPLLGAVVQGARAPVKGVVHARNGYGCSTKLWYALDPFGYVCSRSVKAATGAASNEPVLKLLPGEVVPFHYVMLGVKDGATIPMWDSLESAESGEEPERQLDRGDTVAVSRTVRLDGAPHYVSVEGKVFPVKGTYALREFSPWHGEALDDKTAFPFGWVTPETAKVYGEPTLKAKATDVVARRTRVAILEETGTGARRMLRIAGEGTEARWVRAGDVNEVRKLVRPDGITAATQWIDVDLGEQVLVAYEGDKPVYATLTSSGRAIPTPRGNYPVWAKVSAISMKSQPYEDKTYFVNKVPWVLFFQAHNAIHGAYWHDRFGNTKSHGCVNVSPLDARHLFEWLTPSLPGGWTGFRPIDLNASPTVHVRNSHAKKELVQERPIGPPDKELESRKLEAANERRAQAESAPVAAKTPTPTPTPAPAPASAPAPAKQ